MSGVAVRRRKTAVLSHPEAETAEKVSVSACSKSCPRHSTGRSPTQTVVSKTVIGGCVTVTRAMTMLSQPVEPVNCFIYAPLWVYTLPAHSNCSQTVVSKAENPLPTTVTVITTTLSQPWWFGKVRDCVPALLKTRPFQTSGSVFWQTVLSKAVVSE